MLARLSRFDEVLQHHQKTLKIDIELRDRLGQARQLGNIGLVLMVLSRFREALQHFQKALEINRKLGHRLDQTDQLLNMGFVLKLGRL